MTLEIHGLNGSAPCRILYMTCEALGLEFKDISVNLFKQENKTTEYLKVNVLYLENVKVCNY